jgi:lipopolysaccharide transport system ATP-binding protein
VDEVLAVGDMEFQKKCLGKMNDISLTGERTVLFVSHNMGAISQLCNKAVLLANGQIIDSGTTSEVVKSYMKSGITNGKIDKNAFTGPLHSSIEFNEVIINDMVDKEASISPSEEIKIRVKYSCKKDLDYFRTGITVHSNGIKLFSSHDAEDPYPIKSGEYISEFVIPKYFLRPGEYSLSVFGHDDGNNRKGKDWIYGLDVLSFSVLEEWDLRNDLHNEGVINIPISVFSTQGNSRNVS